VVAVIGPVDRIVDFGEAGDRDNRPEDFAAYDLVVLQRAGDDGRLVVEAGAIADLAAGGDVDVLELGGALDEGSDAVALAPGDQRADLVGGVVRVIVMDGRNGGRQVGDELFVDLLAGI